MPDWPHAPPHRLLAPGSFMVTAATHQKRLVFDSPARLDLIHDLLLGSLREQGWRVQAWSVFPNHYHFVAFCESDPTSLRAVLSKVHTLSGTELNRLDSAPGRKVWYQFRDTALTFPKSYFPRLKYVHHNAVHHGVARVASDYPWCSAGWFERKARPSFRKMIEGFKVDRLNVTDDFSTELDGWRWRL